MKSRLDWQMIWALGALLAVGTLAVVSAASPLPFYGQVLQRHFLALVLGALVFLVGVGINYQIFQDQSKLLYAFTLILLVCVLFFGETFRGTRAWFRLRYFSFQPSELARICMILVLASFLDYQGSKIRELKTVLTAVGLMGPVLILILMQPDFSSSLVFFPITLCMLFFAGASLLPLAALSVYGFLSLVLPLFWTHLSLHPAWIRSSPLWGYLWKLSKVGPELILTFLGIVLLAVLLWWVLRRLWFQIPLVYFLAGSLVLGAGLGSAVLVNKALKGYQKKRFIAFVSPGTDPRGASYNLRQSQIAIGSGGLTGRGIYSGTQSQLGFLPERHTDFVFAVIGEELGFMGTIITLAVYLFVVWRTVWTAKLARDRFGYFAACGVASMFAFYLLVNTGMSVGFLPVVGVPLPLISYGGSNLVTSLWALGIVGSVYARRYAFIRY